MTKGKRKILVLLLAILVMAVAIMPVVKATPEPVDYNRTTGSLKITKYEKPDGSTQRPLAGVKFKIFKVDDDTPDGSIQIPEKYTQPEASATPESNTFVMRESTTIADGTVTFSDLPIGRYLVNEAEAPVNVVQKITNFLIDIPQTTADGKQVEYDVEVAPKNDTVYGSITLTKQDHDGSPVDGAVFKLQQQQGQEPGAVTWVDYPDASQASHTVTGGKIEVTALPIGTYRFIETSVGAANTGYILDNKTTYQFTVSRTAEGATKVEPDALTAKNDKPLVKKEMVTVGDANSNSINDGDTINYKLTVDVPTSIENLKVFKVIDKINDEESLVFNSGSIKVTGIKAADSLSEDLTSELQYTVDNDPSSGATFEINFVPAQLAAYKGKTIEITYSVTFNAIPGKNDLTNTADVTYSNAVQEDADGNSNSDKGADQTTTNGGSEGSGGGAGGGGGSGENPDPGGKVEVHTGGIKILKSADRKGGTALQGAKFKLAKTESEAKAGTYLQKKNNGGDIEFITGSDGTAEYYGLAYGDYYLVEVEAPVVEGKSYNMLTKPELVTVNAESYTTAKEIINRSGTTLPETGGMTTIAFTVGGILLMIVGIFLFKKSVKENNR